jgi:starch-binding outer membrane protein, SusD/RagB family
MFHSNNLEFITMRKIKTIISILTVILASTACTDLSENLYTQVKSTDYGKTPGEIETIVGNAYAGLRGFSDKICISYPTCEFLFFSNETTSDEACIPTRGSDWYDGGRYQQAETHTWKSDNLLMLSSWRYCYEGIGTINAIIYQVKKSALTDTQKATAYAELRGLRAYYYYILLDMFGNVPLITNFEDSTLPTNSTRAQVYAFVESELLDIMDYLPNQVIYGRFTQNVANTLLARLYLNSEVYIGQARWQDCINTCDKVSGYSLESNYFTNFLTENQASKENIFVIPYDFTKEKTVGNYLIALSLHYKQKQAISATSNFTDCVNGICAQPGVYSKFDENDIRRKEFLAGDQISKATGSVILMDNGNALSYTENIEDYFHAEQNEGIRCVKYEIKEGQTWEQDHDWVLMRYAEIIMMKAECYVRLGSPDLARPLVAQIRQRAGLDTPAEITLSFIDDELLREFCFEGLRRTTNIRMGEFLKPNWVKSNTDDESRLIFPIPQYALDMNNKLVQNPGY